MLDSPGAIAIAGLPAVTAVAWVIEVTVLERTWRRAAVLTLMCDVGAETRQTDLQLVADGVGHGGVQPGAGVAPGAVGGGERDVEASGGLLEGQAAEIAELDELCFLRVIKGELFEGGVQGQHVFGIAVGGEGVEIGVFALRPPPCFSRPLRRAFSTRMRRIASAAAPKKWRRLAQTRSLALGAVVAGLDEPQIGLVDEGGGIERLAGLFMSELLGGELRSSS